MRSKIRGSFLNSKLQAVFGGEIFIEGYNIQNYTNENSNNGILMGDLDQSRNYGNVFLVTEYNPSELWRIVLGANINYSGFKSTDRLLTNGDDISGDYGFDPILSPKVSVSRKIGEKLRLYGLVAHGFSLPTFEETLYPNGQINDEIKPESGYNFEIGLKGKLFQDKLYFEIVGYSMYINDLLVARRDEQDDYVGINAGKTIHKGMEVLLDHQLVKNSIFQISHRLALTYMNYSFDEFVDDENGDYSGNELTGVPDHTIDYAVNFNSTIGFYANLNWQNVGSMPMRDDNSIYSDAYNVVNLKLGYRKTIGHFDINAYAGINNLLDEKYASMILVNAGSWTGPPRYYYSGLPINYYAGVRLGYSF